MFVPLFRDPRECRGDVAFPPSFGPLEFGLGTRNPRFVAWPLELGLGTHNPRFVVWPLELGLGTLNPRFVVWPLELGLGTRNPIVGQGRRRTRARVLRHKKLAVVLDAGTRRGAKSETLGVEVGSSLIKGSRVKFLRALIEDVQTRFTGSQCVGSAMVEDWVEASSCSCERVFSCVAATDFGQSTERMCETLWARCNGEAPQDWGPFEVSDELSKTPFRPRKRMWLRSKMVLCLGLLWSRICNFL